LAQALPGCAEKLVETIHEGPQGYEHELLNLWARFLPRCEVAAVGVKEMVVSHIPLLQLRLDSFQPVQGLVFVPVSENPALVPFGEDASQGPFLDDSFDPEGPAIARKSPRLAQRLELVVGDDEYMAKARAS
jgi:hypothetical protein